MPTPTPYEHLRSYVEGLRKDGKLQTDLLRPGATQEAVRIVACAPDESAYEYDGVDGHRIGALTESLTLALAEAGQEPVSWASLIARVRRRVSDISPGQRPEAEGRFGTAPVPDRRGRPDHHAAGVRCRPGPGPPGPRHVPRRGRRRHVHRHAGRRGRGRPRDQDRRPEDRPGRAGGGRRAAGSRAGAGRAADRGPRTPNDRGRPNHPGPAPRRPAGGRSGARGDRRAADPAGRSRRLLAGSRPDRRGRAADDRGPDRTAARGALRRRCGRGPHCAGPERAGPGERVEPPGRRRPLGSRTPPSPGNGASSRTASAARCRRAARSSPSARCSTSACGTPARTMSSSP